MKRIIFAVLCMALINVAQSEETVKPPYYLSNQQLDQTLHVDTTAVPPAKFVRLVYFHRVPGCQTCQKMSRMIFQTVQTQFSSQTQNRALVLRYMNFEDPKNAAFAKAFNVKSPTLIAIEVQNGKDVRYWNLNQIWPLSADQEKFQRYIQSEVQRILGGTNEQ